jgi:hypothetical protein
MAAESPGESFSTNKMTRAVSFQRCIALVSKRRRQFPAFQRSEFSTYYDSQSGLHLPLHNKMEISIRASEKLPGFDGCRTNIVEKDLNYNMLITNNL